MLQTPSIFKILGIINQPIKPSLVSAPYKNTHSQDTRCLTVTNHKHKEVGEWKLIYPIGYFIRRTVDYTFSDHEQNELWELYIFHIMCKTQNWKKKHVDTIQKKFFSISTTRKRKWQKWLFCNICMLNNWRDHVLITTLVIPVVSKLKKSVQDTARTFWYSCPWLCYHGNKNPLLVHEPQTKIKSIWLVSLFWENWHLPFGSLVFLLLLSLRYYPCNFSLGHKSP